MDAPFRPANMGYAYQLHYHLGFRTRRRIPAFRASARKEALREILTAICHRSDYHILLRLFENRRSGDDQLGAESFEEQRCLHGVDG